MKEYAPIALFTYKRLDYLKKTVEALRKNEPAKESDLYIYSDGPRSDRDAEEIAAVRHYLDGIDGFRSIHRIYRTRNIGLAGNIIEGVTTLTEQYGKVIVVEDDIVTSEAFLDYMNSALERYENDEDVMAVSGYARGFDKKGLPAFYFMPWLDCWGWATWKSAWKHFEKDPQKLLNETGKREIRFINVNGTDKGVWQQVVDNAHGKMNTWAIFFYVEICKRKALVLYSRDGYCKSIGVEGIGEHSTSDDLQGMFRGISLSNEKRFLFPETKNYSKLAMRRQEHYCRVNYGLGGAFNRVLIRIKRNGVKNTIAYYFGKKRQG